MTPPVRQRDLSLDSFRGIDVLLMILVNVQGSDDAAHAMFRHAEWHGLTLADAVFPIFLLIVGLSAPLALDRDGYQFSWTAIVRRAALLFFIGVGLSWLIRPSVDPDMIRWTGVLQRIAIVYLVCAVVIALRRGVVLAAVLAGLILAIHSWLLLKVGTASGAPPSMEPGMGISGWLDQALIPGRVLRQSWDPEGVLSTLPSIANGLIGVAVMRWMQSYNVGAGRLALAGLALLIGGLFLTPVLPLNKNLWTASFALVTSGAGIMFWAMLKITWATIGTTMVMQWTVRLGQLALTLYVVHTLLIAVLVRQLPGGLSIWESTYRMLATTGLSPAFTSLLYACIAAGMCCALLPWLQRRGWVLKV